MHTSTSNHLCFYTYAQTWVKSNKSYAYAQTWVKNHKIYTYAQTTLNRQQRQQNRRTPVRRPKQSSTTYLKFLFSSYYQESPKCIRCLQKIRLQVQEKLLRQQRQLHNR